MIVKNQELTKFNPPSQNWVIPLTIFLSTLLFAGSFFIITFCPNFFLDKNPKYFNLFEYIQSTFIHSSIHKQVVLGYLYWVIQGITTFFNIIFGFGLIKMWLLAISYKPWINKYMDESAKIINNCNPTTFNDKVALLVTVCNDFTPNTVLQLCKQTYKNMDCWILDDSFKPAEIEKINTFLKNHPNVHYFKRSEQNRKEHPSQMGNIMAWVHAHWKKYDYIFETNTSALSTDTFVENALCYFHSELLNDRKVGGVIALGSFFYSNTILSWINSQARQFSFNTLDNSSARGTGGRDIVVRGYGSLYSLEAIRSIDWKKAECSVCDVGRGREFVKNGFTIMLDPFDFSGKVGVRDMDGFRKQQIKWNEGHVHMFRNKVSWGPCMKHKPFYMKWCAFFYGWGPIFFLITFVLNIINSVYGVIAVINFPNFTTVFLTGCLWGIIFGTIAIFALINRVPIRLMLAQILVPLLNTSIYYFMLFDTIFTSLICKKWSAKNVTKKNNKNYSFVNKLKLCWKDALWILCVTTICLILQFVVHLPAYTIWSKFYFTLVWPFIGFIIWVFIGEINIKKGWNVDQKEWKDFYKVFLINYNEVKKHPLWQKQHPEDKMQQK